MKLIIAGGRDFGRVEFFAKKMSTLDRSNITEIVCGEAKGADHLGKEWGIYHKIPIKSFPAPWNMTDGKPLGQIGVRADGTRYWKAAGPFRNEEMAKYADALVAFWDGDSKGTYDMIKRAIDHKLDVHIFIY